MPSRRTVLIWGMVLLLAVLDLWSGRDAGRGQDLPSLPAVPLDSVTRVTITRLLDPPIVLEPGEGGWRIVEPIQAAADTEGIERLLRRFSRPLRMDARVDRDNLKDYGLDDGNRIIFEVHQGGEEPVISFYVGFDLPGGVSFVKLRGDPNVYRARVGGRALYDRPPDAWRSRVATDLDPESLVAIEIERPGQEPLRFERQPGDPGPDGAPTLGPWRLAGDPAFDLDHRTVAALAARLAHLRVGEVLAPSFEGGFERPAARVRLVDRDGQETLLVFGSRSDQRQAWLKVEGHEPVYKVAASHLRMVLRPLSDYRSLQVLRLDPSEIRSIRLEDAGVPTEIARTADGGWAAVEPPNLDVDPAQVRRAVATLADLRAHRIADVGPGQAGLDPPVARIRVRTDAGEEVIEVGGEVDVGEGRPRRYARRRGGDRVYELRVDTLQTVLAAFARGA